MKKRTKFEWDTVNNRRVKPICCYVKPLGKLVNCTHCGWWHPLTKRRVNMLAKLAAARGDTNA